MEATNGLSARCATGCAKCNLLMPLLLQHLFPLALLKICVKETQDHHASLCLDSKADTHCTAETTELYKIHNQL